MVREAEIRTALAGMASDDLRSGSKRLLNTLGYVSERTLEASGLPEDFFAHAPSDSDIRRHILDAARAIHIVFQFTNDEITSQDGHEVLAFTESSFETGRMDSFLFVAVDLRDGAAKSRPARGATDGRPSRTDYARMTREINSAFAGVADSGECEHLIRRIVNTCSGLL